MMPAPRRSLEQSSRLWAIASDIADSEKEWFGYVPSKENWYRLLCAGVYNQKIVPNLNGDGVVWLDARTSRMTKEQLSEVIAFAEAWCAEQNIPLGDHDGDQS